MALWPSRASATVTAIQDAQPTAYTPGVSLVPTYAEFQGLKGLWAMQVPAYRRGVLLISGSVAKLPLTQWADTDAGTARFLAQPEATRAAWVTKQRTTQDGIGHGVAYWKIKAVQNKRVTLVEQIPAESVTAQADGTLTTADGDTLHPSNPTLPPVVGRVIVIPYFRDGALIAGVDTLTTALALEAAARNYAETPHPGDVLMNVSTYEMNDTEITDMLTAWTTARQASAAAYLNPGVQLGEAKGWSPSELALAEQRNQAALQIARLLNLDPFWVGASVEGSALTYQNRVDARTDLYGFTLTDYIVPLEQRLSMPDVVGGTVRMDAAEFLRANLDARVQMAVALVTALVITPEEARAWVSDRPTGGPA